MYLIDTNIWLERLLDQSRSKEVGNFINSVTSTHLHITDFAFHSIGVIMSKLDKFAAFIQFIEDVFIQGDVSLIRLQPEEMPQVYSIKEQFKLDFDDAYQYVAASKHALVIVSFDADFDKTELGKRTPGEIFEHLE